MIKVQNISHNYGKDIALKNITIDIKKGEFVAIIGESGSGKSTLLSIISTLLKPTSGEVYFEDLNIKEIPNIDTFRQKNIGFIFQFHYLINYLTIEENIKIANEDVSREEIKELLELLGIKNIINKYPDEISGGEKQRAAIARALINKPKVIFADEPTGNLDSKNSNNVFEILQTLSKQGTTIIVATHDLELASKTNKVIEVKDGQL
jgi:putative ABC transport system ATP-binding protein